MRRRECMRRESVFLGPIFVDQTLFGRHRDCGRKCFLERTGRVLLRCSSSCSKFLLEKFAETWSQQEVNCKEGAGCVIDKKHGWLWFILFWFSETMFSLHLMSFPSVSLSHVHVCWSLEGQWETKDKSEHIFCLFLFVYSKYSTTLILLFHLVCHLDLHVGYPRRQLLSCHAGCLLSLFPASHCKLVLLWLTNHAAVTAGRKEGLRFLPLLFLYSSCAEDLDEEKKPSFPLTSLLLYHEFLMLQHPSWQPNAKDKLPWNKNKQLWEEVKLFGSFIPKWLL